MLRKCVGPVVIMGLMQCWVWIWEHVQVSSDEQIPILRSFALSVRTSRLNIKQGVAKLNKSCSRIRKILVGSLTMRSVTIMWELSNFSRKYLK